MSTGNNNSKLGPVLIIMALAVIVLGVLLYLRSEEKHEIALEKQALTMELADMKEDLEAQVGQNDSLNAFVQYEIETSLGHASQKMTLCKSHGEHCLQVTLIAFF